MMGRQGGKKFTLEGKGGELSCWDPQDWQFSVF